MNPISLNPIILWVNRHLWAHIIEPHIALPNLPAVLHRLDSFLQAIGSDGAGGDRRFGDEEDGCLGDEGSEHGAAYYGLNCRD